MVHEDIDARATTVSPDEAAHRLGVKASTLHNWRWSGRGPRYIKCGGLVRYRIVDIADWLDAHARSSTSGAPSPVTNSQKTAKEE